MLRASPLANTEILPQARQGSYFFNRIARSLPVVTTACAGQVECKQLVSTNAIDWSVTMQMGGQVHAIKHLGSWTQELALRRIATQRKKGGGDHELDPVCAAE